LSGHKNNLTAMVCLMRHEIGHEVQHIGGNVRPWNLDVQEASIVEAGVEYIDDALIALFQCPKESSSTDTPAVNAFQFLDSVVSPDHFDPHAAGIVDVTGNHTDCPLWGTWNSLTPQFVGKILEEELGHSIARSPGGQQINVPMFSFHSESLVNAACTGRWHITFRQTTPQSCEQSEDKFPVSKTVERAQLIFSVSFNIAMSIKRVSLFAVLAAVCASVRNTYF
jgi:hypothetical protein